MVDERVMSILKRVENREITPEEGARQIEELERTEDPSILAAEDEIRSAIDEVQNEVRSAIDEAKADGRSAVEEAKAEARSAIEEAKAETRSAIEDVKEARSAIREAKEQVRSELGQVGAEVKGAIREALTEAESAVRAARHEVKRAVGDGVTEASRAANGMRGTDWVSALNSIFTGLGDALRGRTFSFGGDWSGYPRFEFIEVREGSFGANDPMLDFDCHNGRITVEAWDNDTYRMEVKKIVHASDEAQAKSRAETSIRITESPNCLGVGLIGPDRKGIDVAVKVSVPSKLRYNGRFRFHNGSVSIHNLQMGDCGMSLHNGDCRFSNVAAGQLNVAMHNGRARFDHTSARECTVAMHNGEIMGGVKTEAMTATTHNGRISLSLSTEARLESTFTAHNGVIRLGFEKAEDIGYRLEYGFHAGTARTADLLNALDEVQSIKPKNGAGETKWIGVSPRFDSKPRSISTRCRVHNGEISVGWAS